MLAQSTAALSSLKIIWGGEEHIACFSGEVDAGSHLPSNCNWSA